METKEFAVEKSVVGVIGGRRWAHGHNLERADPVEGKFGLERGLIGVFLGALTNGDREVVDPRPVVYRKREGGGEGHT